MNILVGYASAHGSTAEIARFMGSILAEQNHLVQVANVESVRNANKYDVFILGSAIHSTTILPSMSAFIRRYKDELTLKPVYFWVTCIRVLEPDGWRHVMENYVPYDISPGISPARVMAFAGRVNLEELKPGERWTLAAEYNGAHSPEAASRDYRDWGKIRAWTLEIAADLPPAAAGSETTAAD